MTKIPSSKHEIKEEPPRRKLLSAVAASVINPPVPSAVGLEENKEEYTVFVAVPGMDRKDFSVTIINKKLVVSAAKKEALHDLTDSEEPFFPEWKEIFLLPEDADTVLTAAEYKNGELEIHIPKGKDDPGNRPVELYIY